MEGLIARARTDERREKLEGELQLPHLPPSVAHLWEMYFRIRRRKGSNGFGPVPIEWPDIDAFIRVSGTSVRPWEVRIVEAIDDAYLEQAAKGVSDG